jgi:4-hydroxyphenylpyruvate dioxygenase
MATPRLCLNTITIPGSLPEQIAAAAAAGFAAIGVWAKDVQECPGGIPAAGKVVREGGLAVPEFLVLREFQGVTPERRAQAFAEAEGLFGLMRGIGTDTLLACGTTAAGTDQDLDAAARDLRDLGDLAARHGMRIAYEFLAWAAWIKDIATAWEVVRRADRENVGLILDTFHIFMAGSRLEDLEPVPPHRIFMVHLVDAPAMALDVLQISRHHRVFPGEGVLPIPDLVRRLQAKGFTGFYSLEIFNDEYWKRERGALAKAGMISLRKLFDGVTGRR